MTYNLRIGKQVEKILEKVAKSNKREYVSVFKKVKQIIAEPHNYKPLGNILKGERRVHIGHKVLVFDIIEEEKLVRILRYEHHDKVYKHRL